MTTFRFSIQGFAVLALAVAAAPAHAAGGKANGPALLPEYSIAGGVETRTETVDRPLFNPTRRPAPTPQQEAPKPQMPRGQFALTGTSVVEGKSTAFLRELSGGKSRRVHQGDTVNGMLVAEVKPDRIKLSMGDESEELMLKVIPNPKTTPGAAPAPPPAPAAVPGALQPIPGQPGIANAAPTPQQAAQTLAERRRAARAAAQAAQPQGEQPGTVRAPGTPRADNAPAQGQPPAPTTWADVFRQYQQRGTPPGGR